MLLRMVCILAVLLVLSVFPLLFGVDSLSRLWDRHGLPNGLILAALLILGGFPVLSIRCL